jgi:hypothetical protein
MDKLPTQKANPCSIIERVGLGLIPMGRRDK